MNPFLYQLINYPVPLSTSLPLYIPFRLPASTSTLSRQAACMITRATVASGWQVAHTPHCTLAETQLNPATPLLAIMLMRSSSRRSQKKKVEENRNVAAASPVAAAAAAQLSRLVQAELRLLAASSALFFSSFFFFCSNCQ